MRSVRLGLLALVVAAASTAACQAYNMEEVDAQTVVAVETHGKYTRLNPPTLLIVQDRSGSMEICFDQEPGLGPTNGCDDGDTRVPDRRSRMEVARQVMEGVIDASHESVQFGLVLYGYDPANPKMSCAPPFSLAEPAPDSYTAVADAYASHESMVSPAGGTPTTVALRRAYELLVDDSGDVPKPRHTDRENYVVLVTDGLMNCNYDLQGECICALETGCPTAAFGETITDPSHPEVCLDNVAAIAEVRRLQEAGIHTFVIGLGESFDGSPGSNLGTGVLDQLAEAGGVPKEGSEHAFYSAANAQELQDSLNAIVEQISAPCDYVLDGPVCDGRLIQVNLSIDGELVETSCSEAEGEATWSFALKKDGTRDPQRLVFSPDLCQRMSEAESVDISIKGVENGCAVVDGVQQAPACEPPDTP